MSFALFGSGQVIIHFLEKAREMFWALRNSSQLFIIRLISQIIY